MTTEELLKLITDTADKFQAIDLKVLHVTETCGFADYFVIMSGRSTTHTTAIAEEIALRSKHADRQANSIEGLQAAEWCLLDFGDIVVHVFLPEKREYYDLEGLWGDAKIESVEYQV